MRRFLFLPISLFVLTLAGLGLAQSGLQYQLALPGYHYSFPPDNFNHEDYQTEWWYYTGNLWTAEGRRFGFELTFFRVGVSRARHAASVWNVDDVYMAHLALSDIQSQKFYDRERLNRAGPGIAGIDSGCGKIWNGNWQVLWQGNEQHMRGVSRSFSLQLALNSAKPPVINGVDGVSQKGPGPGQASHYISLTRLAVQGAVGLAGRQYPVKGTAWMDHEFFTENSPQAQAGWDWVSVQFSDQTELMLYRLRQPDGSECPFSAGTFVDAAGRARHLTVKDFEMQPGAAWISPQTHARYPVSWRIEAPPLGMDLTITTPLKSQELVSHNRFTPTYWEGAIDVSGSKRSQPAHGVGYLEMTGYAPTHR
jgi:predicted secreted hydrolase